MSGEGATAAADHLRSGEHRDHQTDAPVVFELPKVMPRPVAWSGRVNALHQPLAAPIARALEELGDSEPAAVLVTLLATLQAFLARVTGATEITVALLSRGQQRDGRTDRLGPDEVVLPIRVAVHCDQPFHAVLTGTRRALAEARANPHANPTAGPHESSLASPMDIPVAMAGDWDESSCSVASGMELAEVTARAPRTEGFPWFIRVTRTSAGMVLTWSYHEDRFDRASMQRLLSDYAIFLAALVDRPTDPLARLPVISDAEHRQVREWNATTLPFSGPGTLHELIEAQAARTPEATAAVHGGDRLTYEMLNLRANHVAAVLRAHGVGPGTFVGVFMTRSLDLPIALLGVLKAGGAYLPLDPEYPRARLEGMLDDAEVRVILTQRSLRERLPGSDAHTTLCLDDEWARPTIPVANPGASYAQPHDIAYLIFTSGSTGRPKGVLIEQRSAVNYLLWARSAYSPGEGLAWALFTSLAFDLTVTSLFVPLISGGRLIIYDEDPTIPGGAVLRVFTEGEAEVVKLTPAHLAVIQDLPLHETRVRRLIVGGEELNVDLARAVTARFGRPVEIFNEYGPTEATVGCVVHRFDPQNDTGAAVPIGRPIANTRIYIRDASGEAVAIGVPGELCIGGAQVARGYLGRPELAGERFIPDPWPDEVGDTLYRTGDLAYWRGDGVLEFLGRLDHQVKLRGFRIELGEIEARVREHPGVADCIVTVWNGGEGGPRLVAYVVQRDEVEPPNVATLRSHLGGTLPEFMIPSLVVPLPSFPLTPNGKVDRKALPDPRSIGVPAGPRNREAPHGKVEQAIASIWQQLLGVDQVGRHDNFFELGGHSLLALRVAAQLRAEGIEVPATRVFSARTVAELARHAHHETALPIPRHTTATVAPTDQQLGLWFLEQLTAGPAPYNLCYPYLLEGDLDVPRLEQALATVVERQGTFSLRFQPGPDGLPLLAHVPFEGVRLAVHDLQREAPDRRQAAVMRIAAEDRDTPFDLQTGPMYRFRLLRLDPTAHVLLMTTHHAVFDGWSFGLLWQEVESVYAALGAGRPAALPELPISYEDYAAWQRRELEGPVLERLVSAWAEYLHHCPATRLPTDRPRPARPSGRGGARPVRLPAATTTDLWQFASATGVSRFSALMTLYRVLLYSYSGQTDLVIGASLAGRGREELQHLMGYFVNMLPFRVSLENNPTFRELVQREVRASAAVEEMQELPFARLVAELRLSSGAGGNPVFVAALNLLHPDYVPIVAGTVDGGWSGPRGRFADLAMVPLEVPNPPARLDLVFTVMDARDGLYGSIEYDADLFDADTIDLMATRFSRLAEAALADPDAPLTTLARGVSQAVPASAAPTAAGDEPE